MRWLLQGVEEGIVMNPLKDLATPRKVVESSLTKVVPADQERHRGISLSDC